MCVCVCVCVCKLIDCNMKRFESDFVFINVPSCDSRRTYDLNSDPHESPNLDGRTLSSSSYKKYVCITNVSRDTTTLNSFLRD